MHTESTHVLGVLSIGLIGHPKEFNQSIGTLRFALSEYWYTKRLLCEDPSAGSPTEHSEVLLRRGRAKAKEVRANHYYRLPTIFSAEVTNVCYCRPTLFSLWASISTNERERVMKRISRVSDDRIVVTVPLVFLQSHQFNVTRSWFSRLSSTALPAI